MRTKQLTSSLLLLLTAAIWGSAFVAQSVGMDYIGALTFNAARSLLAALVLLPVIRLADKKRGHKAPWPIKGGLLCGTALCVASNLQQFGLRYTTVGKAGFLTACYIVIVPFLGLFLKRRCGWSAWVGAGLSLAGLYLLCITDGFVPGLGDTLVFLCAVVYAAHILLADHFAPGVDCLRLSLLQFLVHGGLSALGALCFESVSLSACLDAWLPILYAGLLSSAGGYTLQLVAQKNLDPTVASLLMSLESCFAVLAGWLILDQQLSSREWVGCALMFCAILLVQLFPAKSNSKEELT